MSQREKGREVAVLLVITTPAKSRMAQASGEKLEYTGPTEQQRVASAQNAVPERKRSQIKKS